RASANEDDEAQGFLLTGATRAELSKLRLSDLSARPARRVLLLDRDDLPPEGLLARTLHACGAHVDQVRCEGYSEMMNPREAPLVAGRMIALVTQWLDGTHEKIPGATTGQMRPEGRGAELGPADTRRAATVAAPDGTPILERPVLFGENGRLFGILAEPRSP